MKKTIFPLVLCAAFFIAGVKQKTRFSTVDELGQALLQAFRNNDSLRFLQLYPTIEEASAVFVNTYSDPAQKNDQLQWVDRYYRENNSEPRHMFREIRATVIGKGINWDDVEYVAFNTKKLNERAPGIDYLYTVKIQYMAKGRSMVLKLSDAMQTKEGWNAGLYMRISIESTPEEHAGQIELMKADSARMADSMYAVERYMQEAMMARMMADSTRMADSIKKAVEAQEHSKHNPK